MHPLTQCPECGARLNKLGSEKDGEDLQRFLKCNQCGREYTEEWRCLDWYEVTE